MAPQAIAPPPRDSTEQMPNIFYSQVFSPVLAVVPVLVAGIAVLAFLFFRQRKVARDRLHRIRRLESRTQAIEQRLTVIKTEKDVYEKLARAARDLDLMLSELPDGVFLFDQNRRLSRINRVGTLLEGAEAAFLEGRRCCDMFWKAQGVEECVVDRALKSAHAVEIEMMAGAEGDRPTLVMVLPIKSEDGKLTGGAVVIARDIAELRKAEAEAFEQRSFIASLADLAPDEIYALDREGRLTWMNERARVADIVAAGRMGRPFTEILETGSRELAAGKLAETYRGEDTQFEVKMLATDGTIRYAEAHASPLWRDGMVSGALAFLRDTTERRRTQERIAHSDKLRAVGELAAGVAHNLNNALTVIQGRTQLLLMKSRDEASAKSLEVIARAVADSSQTLRRMLDFARRESSHEFEPIDLTELVASSVEIARPKWQRSSAKPNISVRVEGRDPVYTRGDVAELREVVLNMLFNATDAMPEGGTIEIGTRDELESACLWVADTGKGMSPEVQARIFEPFFTTKGDSGTGLGLSASHGIITRHKGQIMVVSEPGEGTRFEVRLPRYDQIKTEPKKTIAEVPRAAEPAAILIIEDESRIRSILRETLESAGHSVVETSTGSDALDILEKSGFDLVISDLGLPEIGGMNIAHWVKEHRPGTAFLLATGWADLIAPDELAGGCVDALIKKPYSVTDVLDQASKLLAARKSSLESGEEIPA